MKLLKRLIQIDEHQEISDSGYDSVNGLIYPLTLLKYLNSCCIHMPKTLACTKRVLGQPELRAAIQVTHKSIHMPSGKSTLSNLQERTQAHSQIFYLLSQFIHTIPVLSSPREFSSCIVSGFIYFLSSLQLTSAFFFHCES